MIKFPRKIKKNPGKEAVEGRRRKTIIILSILLHILFLLLWEDAMKLNLFNDETNQELMVENKPIVFDLQEPQKPSQVVETPKDAEVVEKQEKANFLSDKNALARSEEVKPDLDLGEAFARGDYKSHELPVTPGVQGAQPQIPQPEKNDSDKDKEKPKEKTEEEPADLGERSSTAYYKDFVLKQQPPVKPGQEEHLPSVMHDNQLTTAQQQGGLSFNTYNWNFAPYMLLLKKKIQRNIFPPPAFAQLGMIDGATLLRFKIYPNGVLKDLEIIDYKGHKTLMETSYNAVDISAPFPVLPSDFPEPFLEVTGKFIYFVKKQQQQ
ncbi:MAG: hypothetical protein GY757_07555 [bacterium]|nr:hypothetical protein [bacterium]